MIRPRFTRVARRELRNLPIGPLIDLIGLASIGTLAAQNLPFPEARPFVVTLMSTSLVIWLLIAGIRPRWTGRTPTVYRFLFTPMVAALLTLAITAGLRQYWSLRALLLFVVGWTLWIAVDRYFVKRFRPDVRILWLGTHPDGWTPDGFPGLDIQVATRPPQRWRGWDVVVTGERVVDSDAWQAWLLHAEMADARILSEHKAYELLTGRIPLDVMRENLLGIAFRDKASYMRIQRALDVIVVVMFSPAILLLCAIVALVVRLDAGPPVIYSQLRTGRNGQPFRLYKFRTMRRDAESAGPKFTLHRDDRMTKIGRFLRTFRIDELPQFWNVLKGEMSIIGPRPEQVPFADEFERVIPLYAFRHSVRPGITGWAQVSQGYAADANQTRDKLSFDLYYVKHQGFLLDAVIVLRTIRTLLSGFGSR